MVFVARTETPVTIEVEGVGANGISTLQPRGSGALAVMTHTPRRHSDRHGSEVGERIASGTRGG